MQHQQKIGSTKKVFPSYQQYLLDRGYLLHPLPTKKHSENTVARSYGCFVSASTFRYEHGHSRALHSINKTPKDPLDRSCLRLALPASKMRGFNVRLVAWARFSTIPSHTEHLGEHQRESKEVKDYHTHNALVCTAAFNVAFRVHSIPKP